jgi:hypothetical protein
MGIQFFVNGKMVGGYSYSSFAMFCDDLYDRNGDKADGLESFLKINRECGGDLSPEQCEALGKVFHRLARVPSGRLDKGEVKVTHYDDDSYRVIYDPAMKWEETTAAIEHLATVFDRCAKEKLTFEAS